MQILMRNLVTSIFLFCSVLTFAQFEDVSAIASDLVYLSNQYMKPAAEGAVYQSSGGWYTSAKKKELWDLELSIQGNILFIPNKSKNFVLEESQLQNLRIQGDATSAEIPTAIGGDNFVVIEGNIGTDVFEFDSPEGINEPNVKHAQLQANLGLWKGTSVMGRYSPKIKINKTSYEIYGFGLNHNLSQWFVKDSTFSVSALAAYSVYSVSDTFSEVGLPGATLNSVVVDGNSLMFNLVASKELGKFNFSAGLGFTSSSFDFTVGGEGDLILSTINQALQSLNESQTNFKADLGVDYAVGDFSLNTMLTFGDFSNLLFGLNYNL